MDRRFTQLAVILIVATIAYSVLGSPGSRITIDIARLKTILLYVFMGLSAYAIYLTLRPPRRPPGV